jgi:hypothetical protein
MGAVANSGVARAVWTCVQDKNDEENHLFLCTKLNIGKKPKGLQYGIVGKVLPGVGEIGCIVWKGFTDVSAEQALSLKGGESGKLTEAKEWLLEFLDSDKRANDVIQAALEEGIAKKTLNRAKNELDIRSEKGSDTLWYWICPVPPEKTAVKLEQIQDGQLTQV